MDKKNINRSQIQGTEDIFKRYLDPDSSPNMDFFKDRDCPVCGERDFRLFMENSIGYIYTRCNKCSMVYMNPVLKKDLLESIYLESGTQTVKHSVWEENVKKYKLAKKPERSERYDLLLKHTNGGKFLDFGCGFGKVTDKLKFYFDTIEGIEIDKYCAEQAERVFKFKVHKDFIQNLDLDEEYDACMMYNNIEHLYNPKEVLTFLYQALKSGGLIYIECPNVRAFSIKIFKGDHHVLLGGEHINMFDAASLKTILSDVGFEIIECRNRKPDFLINDLITFIANKSKFFHRSSSCMFQIGVYKKACSFVDTFLTPTIYSLFPRLLQGAYVQVVAVKK